VKMNVRVYAGLRDAEFTSAAEDIFKFQRHLGTYC